jgi:ribosomal protein S18 acetylase RimI-like enzyme
MTSQITTRAAAPGDEAFLFALFRSVREPEFASLGLDPAQLDMLLRMQFTGQQRTYAAQYPEGNAIVELDGRPIGRIWLHCTPERHRLVDISLLPEFRNRGIGAALLRDAVASARAAGARLGCSVAVSNPGSLRFHTRLGFRIVSQDEVYYELEVEP